MSIVLSDIVAYNAVIGGPPPDLRLSFSDRVERDALEIEHAADDEEHERRMFCRYPIALRASIAAPGDIVQRATILDASLDGFLLRGPVTLALGAPVELSVADACGGAHRFRCRVAWTSPVERLAGLRIAQSSKVARWYDRA